MEISRKIYSGIIKLLKGKNLSSDDSLELADDICFLLEQQEEKNFAPKEVLLEQTKINIEQKNDKTDTETEKNNQPRVFKPYEKVVGGQVDGKGRFHPIQAGAGKGGIRDSNGKIVEL